MKTLLVALAIVIVLAVAIGAAFGGTGLIVAGCLGFLAANVNTFAGVSTRYDVTLPGPKVHAPREPGRVVVPRRLLDDPVLRRRLYSAAALLLVVIGFVLA